MSGCLVRIHAFLLVAVLGCPAAPSQEPAATDTAAPLDEPAPTAAGSPDAQAKLDRLRVLIEQVEVSGREPNPFVLALLRSYAEELGSGLQQASENPEQSPMSDAQIREARKLLNRLSSLLLLPSVNVIDNWLGVLESRDTPVTRIDLLPLTQAAEELRRRAAEIENRLDPELPHRPDGLAKADDLLERFYTLDFELSTQELMEKVSHWETLSPAPTAEELAPVLNAAKRLEARAERVVSDGVELPEEILEGVRQAVARAGTLDLIPFTESLMPYLIEMETRKERLTEAELEIVDRRGWELHDRIEFVRPGMLDHYDPHAPPACARARTVLRRLVALELRPYIGEGNEMVTELESREDPLTEEDLAPLREPEAELRELLVGFEERPVSKSPEAEPDTIQQARQLLWRFAMLDLQATVTEMEPLVTSLENQKDKPTPEELADVNRLAERLKSKLRAVKDKEEAQAPEGEAQEGQAKLVTQANDLLRRSAALQPELLATSEEGRDAPVTMPFLSWFRFYGSLRLRTFLTADGFSRIDDETSRIGFRAQKKIGQKYEIYGRLETGVHPFELLDSLPDLGKDSERSSELFPLRLAYIGVEVPFGSMTLGKVWSSYWDVAVFSDQLPAYTGLTTGTFNRGDGSISGTGRTDNTIQYRGKTGSYSYTGQMQLRNLTEKSTNLGDTLGGSTIYERKDGIELGGAFSLVRDGVENPDSDQPKQGDRAFIAGARYKTEGIYYGATLAYTRNHYLDDLGRFFDGIGFEIYSDYLVHRKIRLRFVGDGLFPVRGHPGEYRLFYLVAGASYDILSQLRVFLLPRYSGSRNSDGSRRGDHAIAILLLFNF